MYKSFLMLPFYIMLLASCGTSGGGFGFPESPGWHATASPEMKRDYFASQCKQFGHRDGSRQMNECIERLWMMSKADARKSMRSINTSSRPRNSQVYDRAMDTYNTLSERRLERLQNERISRLERGW